jgi:hypothetical protein
MRPRCGGVDLRGCAGTDVADDGPGLLRSRYQSDSDPFPAGCGGSVGHGDSSGEEPEYPVLSPRSDGNGSDFHSGCACQRCGWSNASRCLQPDTPRSSSDGSSDEPWRSNLEDTYSRWCSSWPTIDVSACPEDYQEVYAELIGVMTDLAFYAAQNEDIGKQILIFVENLLESFGGDMSGLGDISPSG